MKIESTTEDEGRDVSWSCPLLAWFSWQVRHMNTSANIQKLVSLDMFVSDERSAGASMDVPSTTSFRAKPTREEVEG